MSKSNKYLHFILFIALSACATVKAPDKPVVQNPPIQEQKKDIVLSFVAVGDNLIHGAVYHDAKTSNGGYDFTPMYQYIKPYIQDKDVAFLNQETIIGGKAMGLSHYPQFNSPEEVAEAVVDTGFNVINHATNHSLDKREQGIINTLMTWDQYEDVIVNGINRSEEERDSHRILVRDGVRIGFLAYGEHTNGIPVPANKEYLFNQISEERIQADVYELQKDSDFVMISMHWGTEDSFVPNDMQKAYAEKLCQWGVDVVIGTHPHVIQPVEMKECNGHKMLVMYSLGNFLSAQDYVYNMLEGMMTWKVRFNGETLTPTFENLEYYPLINHYDAGFKNFRVYAWKDYDDELLRKHGLQGYKNQVLQRNRLENKFREVVGNEVSIIFK